MITRTALPFLAILVLHATAGEVALLNIANLLPGFLIGLLAGVWIDRWRRRPVMILTDIGRAIALGAVPLLAVSGHLSLLAVYAIAVIASSLTVFFDVAEQSYIPSLVGAERLVDANSKLAATSAVAEISAFGIAGWLVQWFTAPIAIAVDALTFLFSAGLLGSIRTSEHRIPRSIEQPGNVWRDMLEGVGTLWSNRSLRALALSIAAVEGAFGVVGTVYALFGLRELGFQPGLLGLTYAIGGVSSLAASVYATRINRRFGLGRVIALGLLVATLGTLLLPLAQGAGMIALLLLVGQQLVGDGGATIAEINQTSLRQTLAPPHLMGRVNGGTRVVALGSTLVGTLLGGALGQTAGYRATIVLGALLMALGAVAIATSPVRRIR